MAYQAIPASSSSSSSGCADMTGYFTSLFQEKTGLSPLLMSDYSNDFTDYWKGTTGAAGQGFAVSGTGAAAAYHVTAGNGVITSTSPSGAAGFADWDNGGASGFSMIANGRTKKWLIAYRLAIASAPASTTRISAGIFDASSQFIGLGLRGALTNWAYTRGTTVGATVNADTGKAIDSGGTAYLWMYLYNDTANLNYCIDVVGGAAEAVAEVSSNIGSGTARPYLANEGVNHSDVVNLDGVIACVER